jgi:mannose-6-phosphate isomerase-like protein (cupin superfamily)
MSLSANPMTAAVEPRYQIVDFAELPGVPCPCGTARRGFAEVPGYPATIHVTDIADDARVHYHKYHTETYFILECAPDAAIHLDGAVHPIRPGMCILIPPGVRHRALGRMKIINVVIPKFDPADEHFD